MNKKLLLNIFASYMMLMLYNKQASAQNVGINTTGATPAASAMLDVSSSNKGVLIPRVTLTGTTDATTIPSPATGLLVFNSAAAGAGTTAIGTGFYYWNGSIWASVASSEKNEQYALTSTTLTASSTTTWKIFPGLTQTLNLNAGDRVIIVGQGTVYASGNNWGIHQISLGITSAPVGGPAAGSFVFGLSAGGATGLGKGGTCIANDDFSGTNFIDYSNFSITSTYDVGTTGSYTFDLYIRTTSGSTCNFGGPIANTSNASLYYTVIRQ